MAPLAHTSPWTARRQQLAASALAAFHAYGTWLVGITWRRFIVLSILLVVASALLQELPPFDWSYEETIVEHRDAPRPPATPRLPAGPRAPVERAEPPSPPASAGHEGVDISIDERGVRITPRAAGHSVSVGTPAAQAASAASESGGASATAASAPLAAPAAASGFRVEVGGQPVVEIRAGEQGVSITVPDGADSETVREAVEAAREAVVEAIADAEQARVDAEEALSGGPRVQVRHVRYVDFLVQLALLWIAASAILKVTYKGRIQAEVKAAQATETAEAESLRRQVVEARMAAMQAQVEPHFLFNTLASIDHLIETDPNRASQMQKNLIALLRASMPTMRETTDSASRDLGRELAVVRPYVEILKVRMEERLDARIEVPDGLLSAEFPAMMIQTLVENAIRHGLEPKAEGGALQVRAEIVHGKLQVTVADTGVGFGQAATAGTGVGLANIRERLQLLYGAQASLTITANQPTGTVVTVAVPYRTLAGAPV